MLRHKLQLSILVVIMLTFGCLGVYYLLHSKAASSVTGDINGDNKVDYLDLAILASNYHKTGQSYAQGNLNNDPVGNVDVYDFAILASNWGNVAVGSGPPTTGKNRFGIATGAQGWPSQTEWNSGSFQRNIDDMAAAGVHWVRMTFPWSSIEPNAPNGSTHSYQFTMANNVANYLNSKSIKLAITLEQPPVWSNTTSVYGCGATTKSPQTTTPFVFKPEDYAAFGGALAKDLKAYPNVLVFEMGNEPNHVKPNTWPVPNACEYTVLAKMTYATIKFQNSSLTVLSAGIGGITNGKGSILPDDFIGQMYAENNSSSTGLFDALAYHPYTYPNSPSQDVQGYVSPGDPNNCITPNSGVVGVSVPGHYKGWCRMVMTRDIMVANGDSNKKMWITEFGIPTIPANKAGSGSPLQPWPETIDQTRWTALLNSYLPTDMNGNNVVLPIPTDCGTIANPTADTFPHCSVLNGFLGVGSADTQATMLKQAYNLIETPAYNWAGPIFYFTFNDKTSPELSDNGNGDPNGGDFMGLVDFNGNHKPAYNEYKALEQIAP